MADPQSYRWSSIILAIRQQIINTLGISNTLCRIVASTLYEFSFPDNITIVVAYSGLQPDTDGGAGRNHRIGRRSVRVFIYYRSNTDLTTDDLHALTDQAALGDLEEQIFNCLDEFTPLTSSGTAATIEPLHPIDANDGMPLRPPENDAEGIVRTELSFSVTYVLPNSYGVPLSPPPSISYPE